MNHPVMDRRKERILLVGSPPQGCALLEAYETKTIHHGQEALRLLAAEQRSRLPDLILLDQLLPDMDGHEVAKQIKANPALSGIPVLMTPALDYQESMRMALDAGADEYLARPINRVELLMQIRTTLYLRRLGKKVLGSHASQIGLIKAQTQAACLEMGERQFSDAELLALHRHDPLTGLPNHVYFFEQVQERIEEARKAGAGVAVLFLAFDQLSSAAQVHGRQIRDDMVMQLAAHLGCPELGEHFLAHMESGVFALVIGPSSTMDPIGLDSTIQQCLHNDFHLSGEVDDSVQKLRPRIGGSILSADFPTAEQLIYAADTALCWSKKHGNRQVQWYSPELEGKVSAYRQQWEEIQVRLNRLSPREHEVADLIVAGHTSKSIAYQLGISPRTVDAQRMRIMDKLQIHNLADLVRMMMEPPVCK